MKAWLKWEDGFVYKTVILGEGGGDAVMLGGRAAGSYQGRPNVFEQEEEGKERKENEVHSKQGLTERNQI